MEQTMAKNGWETEHLGPAAWVSQAFWQVMSSYREAILSHKAVYLP